MSGAEVLGIISSTISIIDAIVQICGAIRDASGLPPAFRNVLQQMPLLKGTLKAAQQGMENGASEGSHDTLKRTLEGCQTKVNSLEKLFQAVIVQPGASRTTRYTSAIRSFGKEHRVEELMDSISIDMQILTANHAFQTVKTSQIQGLVTGMRDAMNSFSSPCCSITNYGTGPQSIHSSTGDLNFNNGSGSQFNGNFTGSITLYSS